MSNIKKYVSAYGTTLEIGDFYGGGDDEVITVMKNGNVDGNGDGDSDRNNDRNRRDNKLTIYTNHGYWELTLKPGDYLVFVDGSSKILKTKAEELEIEELEAKKLEVEEEQDYKEALRKEDENEE